jgi:hypothetical protein
MGLEHTRKDLEGQIEESRGQIEEYERKKTALNAIEDLEDHN